MVARKNRQHIDKESHILSKDSTYRAWSRMKSRCNSDLISCTPYYRDKGIRYDERWEYFSEFLSDMGFMPDGKYHLDRIDGDRGYSKENCRWVHGVINAQNKAKSSELRGAYKNKVSEKYISRFCLLGFRYNLGTYKTEEEAHQEYKKIFHEWYGFYPERHKEKRS